MSNLSLILFILAGVALLAEFALVATFLAAVTSIKRNGEGKVKMAISLTPLWAAIAFAIVGVLVR
jgi:hypothetical protein